MMGRRAGGEHVTAVPVGEVNGPSRHARHGTPVANTSLRAPPERRRIGTRVPQVLTVGCAKRARPQDGSMTDRPQEVRPTDARKLQILGAIVEDYVSHVATANPLSPPNRRAIQTLLEDAGDVEELLSRTVRLLAQTTQQVAMVQYPARRQARIRHVELVKVADSLLLLVLITESGR